MLIGCSIVSRALRGSVNGNYIVYSGDTDFPQGYQSIKVKSSCDYHGVRIKEAGTTVVRSTLGPNSKTPKVPEPMSGSIEPSGQ